MRETWRWFGEFDGIPLADIAQSGAQGIVSSLHAVPYGQVWQSEDIAARNAEINAAGFTWDVVESLPVHEDIKKGTGDLNSYFTNYRQSMANLASQGVHTICYNFMPILDWTRTDLQAPVKRGGTCLRFSAAKMAAFEIHMLGREGAEETYSDQAIRDGGIWFETATDADKAELLQAIMAGLPGAVSRYDIDGLLEVIASYQGITHDDLRANLARFLQEVIPSAEDLGVNLCIHPDDPPRDILGLPRIVSTASDIAWILQAVDSPAIGLTLCTGSLGAHPTNDLVEIANRFADRTYFAHLRNVRKDPDGSFKESGHLDGDVDMVGVIRALLKSEAKSGRDIPFRSDHGHMLLTDIGKEFQPGYSLIGRMRGLAELRGVMAAVAT